ncbi:MAG: hypothetical protein ACYTE6_10425 [Planctomycetota bacterium]|jgi:hypothetical protein
MDWRLEQRRLADVADDDLAAECPQRPVEIPQVNGDDVRPAGLVHGRQQAVAHLAAGAGDQGGAGAGEAAVS